MVLTYSPHRDGGGALHLLSPTHVHHHDANSAIAQIRRSLSRSPSKGPTFRLVTSKSASPSPSSPLSPSPLSPQVRSRSSNLPLNDSSLTPFPPGAKKNRPGARRLSPMRTSPHSLSGQRSPAKRALSDSTDNGNASPQTSMRLSSGIENERQSGLSPEDKSELQGFGASSYVEHSEPFLAPRSTYVRRERPSSGLFDLGAKSSPLKRGDGGMNLELAQLGSPSAKRRSLHGASFGPDFDIFDQSPSMHDRSPTDSTMGEAPGPDAAQNYDSSSTGFSPMPRRTSSLRKTTLQQRYEKPQFARARPGSEANFDLQTPGAANSKARSRLSLDNVFPVPSRESPFSSQGSLPNASVHPITHGKNLSNAGNNNQSQRHPLSRTITQSSSNSSVAEDSPTHVPVRHGGLRRLSIDFSKSLPMGSLRPASKEPSTTDSSQGSSFATPDSYKLAKPLPAAFMSTGLISKRNKHINEEQMDFRGSIGNMPDTPCKRPVSMAAVVPVPTPDLNPNRSRQSRPTSHSFGTPSTPFNPHNSRPAFGGLGKGASIFGSTFNGGGHSRRGSFLSTDGEESSKSPCNFQSQSSNEFDIPPTPTKQVSAPQKMQQRFEFGGQTDPQSPLKTNDQGTSFESPRTELNCKLNIFSHKNGGEVDGESGSIVEASPSAALRFGSLNTISSFSHRFDVTGKSYSPASLSRKPSRIPLVRARMMKAKSSPLSPASPIYNRHARSPHTPSESMVPPDPSGLSISARADKVSVPLNDSASLSSSLFPPATPTATRDSLARSSKFGSSVTPVHGSAVAEVDISISAKFDKVELVGNGEFSQVFKVVRKPQPSFQGFFAAPAEPTSPNSPHREQVWAVKKSRHHYIGQKDRQRKLQEVEILKSLGHSDHSIQFFDSWEEKGHLYIQTEFCDEGSLDLFLDQVGRNARLDDFRIWKILLEMTLGLKHIHDSGFIHLDLKPANVLVTFEGALKVADFGMATSWPAKPGIEGEGDREYIGPEILRGIFDKPADIFALGLIMLEIAGNVMLPENGASWQRLRSGDMSDVPSLTFSSENSIISRDSLGKPITHPKLFNPPDGLDNGSNDFGGFDFGFKNSPIIAKENVSSQPQALEVKELQVPPGFMVDANHEQSLDNMVRWMIRPDLSDRPTVDDLLRTTGVNWADARRRAGATIYEGNWGPADKLLQDDAEMIDV